MSRKIRKDINILKKDFTGNRFGRLLVTGFAGWKKLGKNNKSMWKCRCDCGKECITRGDQLTARLMKSCGCYTKEITIQNNKKRVLPPEEASSNIIYFKYLDEAKKRNLKWNLTRDEFNILIKGNCYYCGINPNSIISKKWPEQKYNGIDRIINEEGYYLYNCASCCKRCNFMKNNLSKEDFLNHIKRISLFQKNSLFKEFYLLRTEDISNISGVGIVARGIIFPKDGKVVMEWESGFDTLNIFSSIEEVKFIHSHEGKTKIIMVN